MLTIKHHRYQGTSVRAHVVTLINLLVQFWQLHILVKYEGNFKSLLVVLSSVISLYSVFSVTFFKPC